MALSPEAARIVLEFNKIYYHGLDGKALYDSITFLGIKVLKCPLDLWICQEILHRTEPEIIVECGVRYGGSTLFLACLCDLMGRGRVVACDITLEEVDPRVRNHPRVELVEGSSTDPTIHDEISKRCGGRRTMVILDSDHSERHVSEELRLYSPLVSPGCYLICEDTNINGHPVYQDFGPGPYEAVTKFLAGDKRWRVDTHCERLLATFNPSGYLLRLDR
jgi:cephalosporin hydroxylase